MAKQIKVLIIDDSAMVRQILAKGLGEDPNIEIVGTASDVYIARDLIIKLRPDVLTLDVEMPRMDGVEFLRRLMPQYPIPVVMVSSLTQKGKQITLDALEAGAIDYVSKPTADVARGLESMIMELRTKVQIASTANVAHWKSRRSALASSVSKVSSSALAESTDKVIAIGASTGGTEAIKRVICDFPLNMPGTVIVQHMPAGFTKTFADRLNTLSILEVKEAESGDRILPGRVLIAPGGLHMKVIRSGGIYQVVCQEGEKVNGHCPSVDVLFNSVAQCVGANAYGIILTGMGDDGARGMKAMKEAGSFNFGQDENSSVVYGMPKVAYEMGGVDLQLPLEKIATGMIGRIRQSQK